MNRDVLALGRSLVRYLAGLLIGREWVVLCLNRREEEEGGGGGREEKKRALGTI